MGFQPMSDGGLMVYEPELLKTFLAVSQSLSFTRAAESLGIRQPTVSQHVRRLEEAVGRPLFVRDTRSVALTSDGEAMAGFARDILAAQERAVGYFTGSHLSGRLRFGVTDDLALTPLPRILRDFRQLYPRIDLELAVLQNESLLRRIESGHRRGLRQARRQRPDHGPRTAGASRPAGVGGRRHLPFKLDQPVPLVVYQAPSLSRSISVQALEGVGRRSRITCTVRGVNGVLAAVRAGLGIAVMARSLMPPDLLELPASSGLPKLPHLDLVLLTNRQAPPEAAKALTSAILASGAPLKPVSHA